MKQAWLRIPLLLLTLLLPSVGLRAQDNSDVPTNPKPFVVPELTSWTGGRGTYRPTRIVLGSSSREVKAVAEELAKDYAEMFGRKIQIDKGPRNKGDLLLRLVKPSEDKHNLGKEGYRLIVGEDAVLEATHTQGLYWGTRTLLQLSEQGEDQMIPCGTIIDKPQYTVRGLMLDVGRKYIPMDYLQRLIRVLAYYKMNTLQLHLNDNGFKVYFGNDWAKTSAAFRLESTTFPGLAPKGASYSKAEFIDLQKQAERIFVDIIPEIDIPAHTLAFTHYRPELASKEHGADHLDIFKEETYTFIDALLKEYLGGKNPVFRSKHINIGTDEYSNATEELREKFRYFTDRYIRYVESFGKQAYLWGALRHAYGKTPVKLDQAVVLTWSRDFVDPIATKEAGAKLISTPDSYTYIVPAAGSYQDYLDTRYLHAKWTPAVVSSAVTLPEGDPALLGGMFSVWNDHYGNGISVKDIHHRIMPALHYMALKMWTGSGTSIPYEEMEQRRLVLSEAPGVNELARWQGGEREVLHRSSLPSSSGRLGEAVPEIGYDYSVTFTIDAREEAKGTVLLRSRNATFYLADPRHGRLGFARDGYLDTFDYTLPKEGKVTISIEGDNNSLTLYVDGKRREHLSRMLLYAETPDAEALRLDKQYESPDRFEPIVYRSRTKGRMFYMRTLVFPLDEVGTFRSNITDLRVHNYKLHK